MEAKEGKLEEDGLAGAHAPGESSTATPAAPGEVPPVGQTQHGAEGKGRMDSIMNSRPGPIWTDGGRCGQFEGANRSMGRNALHGSVTDFF